MQTDHRDQRQDWITNRGVAVQRFYLSWLRAKGLWSTLPMTNMWLHIPPTVSVPWLPKAEDLKVHFRDCLVVFVHTNGWNCKNLLYNILFVQKCGSWVVQLSICIYTFIGLLLSDYVIVLAWMVWKGGPERYISSVPLKLKILDRTAVVLDYLSRILAASLLWIIIPIDQCRRNVKCRFRDGMIERVNIGVSFFFGA